MDKGENYYKSRQFLEELVEGMEQMDNSELIKSNSKENKAEKENVEKRILERHKFLYDELQKCTDIDTYNKLWKEFAELDMKVARIKSDDNALRSRCEVENQYTIIK